MRENTLPAAEALVTTRVDVKFDQYGRYKLPDPLTGKERSWTRATTVANTLADRYALEQWGNRNVVLGIAARPDLYALASSTTPDDKRQLNQIVEDAQEAAKSRSAANLGSALHQMTARIDSGELLDVPKDWRPDIDAYLRALADHHIKISPDHIEGICVVPSIGVAGQFDRLISLNGDMYVADLKTGQYAITYQATEIALQLAIYAGATHIWNGDGYDPMPKVNRDKALAIWLPAGQGTCELHWVDIEAGREAVYLALGVREWRKRKDLTFPISTWTNGGDTKTDDDW